MLVENIDIQKELEIQQELIFIFKILSFFNCIYFLYILALIVFFI